MPSIASGDRSDQGDQGQRPHRGIPGAMAPAQQGGIDPVRHTAHVIPRTFPARGVEHDFAGDRGHVELGAGRVVERDAIQRAVTIEPVRHRPLIVIREIDERCLRRFLSTPPRRCLGDHKRQRCGFYRRIGQIVSANRADARSARHNIDRSVASLEQPDTGGVLDATGVDGGGRIVRSQGWDRSASARQTVPLPSGPETERNASRCRSQNHIANKRQNATPSQR